MADIVDISDSLIESTISDGIAAAQREAAKIPAGYRGECNRCGEHSGRLVAGVCAPCRDFENRQYTIKI